MQSWLEYDLASAMIDRCNGTLKQKIEIQKAIFKSGITEWNFRSGSSFVRNHRNLSAKKPPAVARTQTKEQSFLEFMWRLSKQPCVHLSTGYRKSSKCA